MKAYVCGFLFSEDRSRVLLVEKRRPTWQAGRLNGIGGKIEEEETPLQAMQREFEEEAGISGFVWDEVCTLSGPTFRIHFFADFSDRIDEATSVTDEVVRAYEVADLWSLPALESLRTFIPLALDRSGIRKPVHFLDDIDQP